MILVETIQERDRVVNVVADGFTTDETPGLGRSCQGVDLLIAGNGIAALVSTGGGAHVFADATVVLNINLAVPVADPFTLVLVTEMPLHVFRAIDGCFQSTIITSDHVGRRKAVHQS